jgi:prepilin-type N-terminal cleavage/methylation domain-containing protein
MSLVCSQRRCAGFTLIELLVVVAIIALLIAILMPSLSAARGQAQRTACLANLHAVYLGCLAYAHDYRDRFPDAYTTGGIGFRRGPLEKDPDDPSSLPEKYGLAAVLGGINALPSGKYAWGTRYLPAPSKTWICPAHVDWMQAYKNTYEWAIAAALAKKPYYAIIKQSTEYTWVWDAYTKYPYRPSGFRAGSSAGTAIPEAQRYYPHTYSRKATEKGSTRYKALNCVYLDGHAGPRRNNN